ncbi:MAG: hypothetical protein QXX08_08325, partial [Candidatus Bathyarchaeia archaeon]
ADRHFGTLSRTLPADTRKRIAWRHLSPFAVWKLSNDLQDRRDQSHHFAGPPRGSLAGYNNAEKFRK